MRRMLQNLDVYVTPVINVDGYVFSWATDTVSALRGSPRGTPHVRPSRCLSSVSASEPCFPADLSVEKVSLDPSAGRQLLRR